MKRISVLMSAALALTVSVDQPDRVKRVVSLNPYDYGETFGGGIRRSSNGWMVGMFNVFGSYTLEPRFVAAAVPPERDRNREAIPGSELFTIDQAGHFTSLERPAEVAMLILSQRTD